MIIDRASSVPPYLQLVNHLAGLINSGKIAHGEKLPSETELEQSTGLSRLTVRKAVKELKARKLAHTTRGLGTYAGPAPKAEEDAGP